MRPVVSASTLALEESKERVKSILVSAGGKWLKAHQPSTTNTIQGLLMGRGCGKLSSVDNVQQVSQLHHLKQILCLIRPALNDALDKPHPLRIRRNEQYRREV